MKNLILLFYYLFKNKEHRLTNNEVLVFALKSQLVNPCSIFFLLSIIYFHIFFQCPKEKELSLIKPVDLKLNLLIIR